MRVWNIFAQMFGFDKCCGNIISALIYTTRIDIYTQLESFVNMQQRAFNDLHERLWSYALNWIGNGWKRMLNESVWFLVAQFVWNLYKEQGLLANKGSFYNLQKITAHWKCAFCFYNTLYFESDRNTPEVIDN